MQDDLNLGDDFDFNKLGMGDNEMKMLQEAMKQMGMDQG